MTAGSTIALVLVTTALSVSAMAQQPAAAATATPLQPELVPLIAPRAAELSSAGIQKIAARTDKKRRNIQVLTTYGPIYFGWPKNVTPVTFEIEVGTGSAVTVRAKGDIEANKARYAAAFDAIVPVALRQARDAKARAERPRK